MKKTSFISLLMLISITTSMLMSCIKTKEGCTDSKALNYDSSAKKEDGSCKFSGCTDPKALNYDSKATNNDGSCKYPDPCETNKTGEVYFTNRSNSNSTHDIIWDGVKIATIAPNESSKVFTFSANVQHTLVFRHTNSSDNACNPSSPYLIQCQKIWFDCTG